MSTFSQASTSEKRKICQTIIEEALNVTDFDAIYIPKVPEHRRVCIYILQNYGYDRYQQEGADISREIITQLGHFYCKLECSDNKDDVCSLIDGLVDNILQTASIDSNRFTKIECVKSILPELLDKYSDWLESSSY